MNGTCINIPIKPRGNTVFYVGVKYNLNGKVYLVADSKSVTRDSQSLIVDFDRIKPTPANVSSILFQYYSNLEGKTLRHPTDEEALVFIATYESDERLVFDTMKTVSKTDGIGLYCSPQILCEKPNSAFAFDYFRTDFKQLFVEW